MNTVRPQLKLLNKEQIQQVYRYALRILSETGVRVDSPSVVEMLGKTGQVEVQGRSVELSFELVEDAIRSAPSVIQMYDRHGNPVFHLGDDRLCFGVGVTAPNYQEPEEKGYYVSGVHPRWPMERWQVEGQPEARQVLREKTSALLADLSSPEDYEELVGKGSNFIGLKFPSRCKS